jgi:hypothetical protein
MGNIACLYEGKQMSAFDSAMLMIDDLSKQVNDLNQKVWELQLALWHSYIDPIDGRCSGKDCPFCATHSINQWEVEKIIDEA